MRRPVLALLPSSLLALAGAADLASSTLEQLHAANQARQALASTEATWVLEQQRLHALIAATRAETARLERDAAQSEQQRDEARNRLAALGQGSDLDALRTRLAQAGAELIHGLTTLSTRLPPGVVPATGAGDPDGAFDAAVRALEAGERATASVAIEVITGRRDGHEEAVKVLRVAGAAAWWIALDGLAAGIVRITDGQVELLPVQDDSQRAAILAALAQAEGRATPALALLPGVAP